MTISELCKRIGARAPWSRAAGWDPVGLQAGDPDSPVRAVAVCHEVTEEVVAHLEEQPVDLVVSYHPVLFRPTNRLVAGRSPEGRAYRLIRTGTALAAVHTNFDAAPGGTADALADAIELEDVAGFGPLVGTDAVKIVTFVPPDEVADVSAAMARAGAGVIGNYTHCSFRTPGTGSFLPGETTSPTVGEVGSLNEEPETRLEMVAPRSKEAVVVSALVAAHPYEEPALDVYDVRANQGLIGRVGVAAQTSLGKLADRVRAAVGEPSVRVVGKWERKVERIAVVPGSGSDFIAGARQAGAEVLVTGDVSHHSAVRARDARLAVIDPGHAPTERPGVKRLYAAVSELAPEAIDLTDMNADPWRWRG